jgi:hypothetical protein
MPSVIASTPMLGRVMLIGSGVDTKVFQILNWTRISLFLARLVIIIG